jgi:hypothetical protein
MTSTVYVYTMRGRGKGSWSRYTFPFNVDGFAQLGDPLYIRSGDQILEVTEDTYTDDTEDTLNVPVVGVVHTPHLDFGQPGVTKTLHGIDVVATRTGTLEVGADQRNPTAFPFAYTLNEADTVPGTMVGVPMAGPSFAVRLTFTGGAWKLYGVNAYLADNRPES